LVQGNHQADALTLVAHTVPQAVEQARISHAFFHQNARALQKAFSLTPSQAKNVVSANVVSACPECQHLPSASLAAGVNPRGLTALELWQTDVTHFPDFGRLKYIHVSIDTFSGAVYATCH
ncbi:POK7 protein, partial [Chionis minor]|nr:POK7 protein [Chionis minor]